MQFLAVLAQNSRVYTRNYQNISVYSNIAPLIWRT
jgi:hypothetical protein